MNHQTSSYKVVIYDCDGVMLDSIESNYVFYDSIMKHLGRPLLDRNDHTSRTVLHTYSFLNVMKYFFEGDPQEDAAMAFARTIHYRDLVRYMRIEDGLIDTLEKLKGLVSLAICTNRASSMEMIIEDFGMNGLFSCIMTAGKVANPKPHPEPLLKILEHYGVAPCEALFVGDAEVDRQAAQGAGVHFIAYKSELPGCSRINHHSEIFHYLNQ
ncbi:MAG TPA: HAD family hydrolase [Deltaproteobacteria bacterium]|nr:HAD family hydrolase [Deltaproteobacteria bacterium]HQB38014.1 HAD family hydrolase [Deltaproteobacteria bacterium]